MNSTVAILASDFSDSTTDVLRNRWTVAKMEHLIAALKGATVAITTDRQSGHTLIGVQLVDAFHGGAGRGTRVAVKMELSDGTEQTTNYYLPSVGEAIIPLTDEGANAKWTALETYRAQVSQAIKTAMSEHGETEGRAWGAWKGTPLSLTEVDVTYTPHTGNEHFADRWGTRWYGRVATA